VFDSALRILTGFVSDDPGEFRGSLRFALGEPPKKCAMPCFGTPPFARGEYIAVAATESLVSGCDYTALAYRRLGVNGATHPAGWLNPALLVLLGVSAPVFQRFEPAPGFATQAIVVGMVCAGIVGAVRIWFISRAFKMLTSFEPPLTTRSSGRPNSHAFD